MPKYRTFGDKLCTFVRARWTEMPHIYMYSVNTGRNFFLKPSIPYLSQIRVGLSKEAYHQVGAAGYFTFPTTEQQHEA